mgnify:CR=1 FL=1
MSCNASTQLRDLYCINCLFVQLDQFNTPPPMTKNHPHYESILKHINQFEEAPAPDEFPLSESLQQTIERTIPYWNDVIAPQILKGKNVIIVGHGANLKGLAMHLGCRFYLVIALYVEWSLNNETY